MNGYRGILFDLDGVLIDTGGLHAKAWMDYTQKIGRPVDHAFFIRTFGQRNDEVFAEIFGKKLDPAEATRLAEEKEAYFRTLAQGKLSFLPGSEEALRFCASRDIPRIIATSTPRSNMEFFRAELGLDRDFKNYITGDDVQNGKPNPEIFIKAAERLGLKPAETIVIEDSFSGIEAAKAGGIQCIALATTRTKDALRAHGRADRILSGPQELAGELKKIFA